MSNSSKPLPQCNQSVVVSTTTESGRSFYGDKLTIVANTEPINKICSKVYFALKDEDLKLDFLKILNTNTLKNWLEETRLKWKWTVKLFSAVNTYIQNVRMKLYIFKAFEPFDLKLPNFENSTLTWIFKFCLRIKALKLNIN